MWEEPDRDSIARRNQLRIASEDERVPGRSDRLSGSLTSHLSRPLTEGDKKRTAPETKSQGQFKGCQRRPTLPRSLERSTIGAVGLNDRVRNGNGCGPYAPVASELGDNRGNVIVEEMNLDRWYFGEGNVGDFRAWRSRIWVSQASRAIRTAALGTSCDASTCGLSTE